MYEVKIQSGDEIEIKVSSTTIILSETLGHTVGKIEMGDDKISSGGFVHRRSKLEEFKISDTVVPRKTRRKRALKSSELWDWVGKFIEAHLLPKPKGKRGRPKGKKRWPRLSKKIIKDEV